MKIYQKSNTLGDVGVAIGIGLLAGIAGTAAITLSQAIEAAVSNRRKSATPAYAVEKVLQIQPKSRQAQINLSEQVHWVYGSGLGVLRGLIALSGIRPLYASAFHFGIIWGTELALLPALKLAPPISRQTPKAIALDAVHHIIYTATTGLVYSSLAPKKVSLKQLI